MERFCAACGKQLQPGQGFCEHCGAAWAEPGAPVATGIAPTIPPKAERSAGPMIVALLAVVALAFGGWMIMRNRKTAAPIATASAVSSTASTTSVTSTTATTASVVPSETAVEAAAIVALSGTTAPGSAPATDSGSVEAAAIAALSDTPATGTETGSLDGESAEAAASKPCSLITAADMGQFLGAPVVKLTTTGLSCSYFTTVDRSAQVDTTWTGGKDAYAQVKRLNAAPGLSEPVAALGDDAYLQAAGVLHLVKGDTYIVVNSREYPKELDTESAIARKILEKLQ